MPPAPPAAVRSRIERHTWPLFLILSLFLAATVLTARGLVALGTPDVLDWDETYYASTTATAAHGLGVYPFIQGYPRIHAMGGMGYVVYLYVLAYEVFGPHLQALRLVSFLASLVGVAGVTFLTWRLYGSAAGLAALALTPSLHLFESSNTIRLDVFAIAFVAWSLVLYTYAAGKSNIVWHVTLGLLLALGLEVHLHTAAAAFAVGLAYLVRTFRRGQDDSDAGRTSQLAGFLGGYAAGVLAFLLVNVWPDPHGFFRSAALARLSAVSATAQLNLTAPMDLPTLMRSFLSPAVIVPKEIARYRSLAHDMRWWELVLWLGTILTLLFRGRTSAAGTRLLAAGALIGAGIVFNSSSPLYASAILPFFVPHLAMFVTCGLGATTTAGRNGVPPLSVALLMFLSLLIVPRAISSARTVVVRIQTSASPPSPMVSQVTRMASPECVLAGPSDLYARYFMAYPQFVGTRDVEVLIGSRYYDLQDQPVRYWQAKQPDIVFGPAAGGLGDFLHAARYEAIGNDIWIKPAEVSPACVLALR